MAGFRFLFAELLKETVALKTMAKSFLDPSTMWVLERFLSDLRTIGGSRGENVKNLQFQCLNTIPSDQYEGGNRRGGKKVYAVISGTWALKPLGNRPSAKREIELCGIASTRIELYASDDAQDRLAMWRLELGAEDSPGCYVHSQILGDSNEPPFPKCLPIPRLPSLFITPMSAVEFVLGELFQDNWAKMTASDSGDAQTWRTLQSRWFNALFSWYLDCIENAGSSSWMTIKESKPQKIDMFLSD